MRDHASEAVKLSRNVTRESLDDAPLLELALTRLVKIIGEAATRVSPELRSSHPEVEWGDSITMRNRLVHGYEVLDLDILWDTVQNDSPRLVDALNAILASGEV